MTCSYVLIVEELRDHEYRISTELGGVLFNLNWPDVIIAVYPTSSGNIGTMQHTRHLVWAMGS